MNCFKRICHFFKSIAKAKSAEFKTNYSFRFYEEVSFVSDNFLQGQKNNQ